MCVSSRELDLDLAEALLNWDTMSHTHGGSAPVPLRKMTVTRREALIRQIRAIQAVAHAYVDAVARSPKDEGAPLALRITETDRQTFNKLLQPVQPAHYQLGNKGGLAYVQQVERDELDPQPYTQVTQLAELILGCLRGIEVDLARCGNPKCDKGAHKRAILFIRELSKRAVTRYCCSECRKQAAELREKAEEKSQSSRRRKGSVSVDSTPAEPRTAVQPEPKAPTKKAAAKTGTAAKQSATEKSAVKKASPKKAASAKGSAPEKAAAKKTQASKRATEG